MLVSSGLPQRQNGSKPFDPYLGPSFSEREIERCLDASGVSYKRVNDVEGHAASLLADGKVLGRFDGRMEYGPRALGNRSILVDARLPNIHDELSRRLRRTEFMPFAPSILDCDAGDYCRDLEPRKAASLYMTICLRVSPSKRGLFGSASHVDDTARVHVVTQDMNPSFHGILGAFAKLSGVPLVLNTSFNNHEEPIVCSPEDALRLYTSGSVDALAIGPFIVT
jgi:carbamoyltransferase